MQFFSRIGKMALAPLTNANLSFFKGQIYQSQSSTHNKSTLYYYYDAESS